MPVDEAKLAKFAEKLEKEYAKDLDEQGKFVLANLGDYLNYHGQMNEKLKAEADKFLAIDSLEKLKTFINDGFIGDFENVAQNNEILERIAGIAKLHNLGQLKHRLIICSKLNEEFFYKAIIMTEKGKYHLDIGNSRLMALEEMIKLDDAQKEKITSDDLEKIKNIVPNLYASMAIAQNAAFPADYSHFVSPNVLKLGDKRYAKIIILNRDMDSENAVHYHSGFVIELNSNAVVFANLHEENIGIAF